MIKPWHFEIGNNGPDWHLDIAVNEPQNNLTTLIRNIDLPGFRLYKTNNKQGSIIADIGSSDWYIDEFHFTDFVNNIENTTKKNIWAFQAIEVDANFLRIVHGYGYTASITDASEIRMLQTIIDSNIEIINWRIFAGGDGYQCINIAEGKNRQELSVYLLE